MGLTFECDPVKAASNRRKHAISQVRGEAISLGGWGVRELAGVALFAALGHGSEEAVAALALPATLTLVASLGGAVALVWRTR